MDLTFLGADYPLVKSFAIVDGSLEKSPYPNAFHFWSETKATANLKTMLVHIQAAAKKGQCLLKGNITKELKGESRAGATTAESKTQWICLDIDGLQGIDTHQDFMTAIGLGDCSYIVQYSASMGVGEDTGLRAHIFAILAAPMPAPFLKQWLTGLNLDIKSLREELSLTRTGTALRWPLDITCCQNDKLIYIAPPKLGPGVVDNFRGKRIELISNKLDAIPIDRIKANIARNQTEQAKVLASLRKAACYPAIKQSQYKVLDGQNVLLNPGEAIITGIKNERGFVYFNLNGGDSWAYFHPEDDPQYIRNFKGEPTYKTEELLPEYWKSVSKVTKNEVDGLKTRDYLVLRDFKTDRLFNGYYDAELDEVILARAANETRLKSFMKQHGQPIPEFIPDWSLEYDPTADFSYLPSEKRINLYRPCEFAGRSIKPVKNIPKIVDKVLTSAVGSTETKEHFLNWLAYIVQTGRMTKTAWVLHGNQGTGKGVLFHKIIKPVLGASNCVSILQESLETQFNGWAANMQLVFVDEVQISKLMRNSMANANLKHMIVEPTLPIRRMHSELIEVTNFVNFIFASNQADPVVIEASDRRFNVGEFQLNKLELTDKEVEQLDTEIEAFWFFLKAYKVDAEKAQKPLDNADRAQLISINRSSIDEVSDAVLSGNMEFLIDMLPAGNEPLLATPIAGAYKSLLISLLVNHEKYNELSREELRIIFEYCVGNMPVTPHKFTSFLKHHRIYIKKVRRGAEIFQGINVSWQGDKRWYAEQIKRYALPAAPVTHINKARVG